MDIIGIIAEYKGKMDIETNNETYVLFDDEEHNRTTWTGRAFDVNNILEILREI